ncbi:hypothetical protein PV325_008890, partial [Microctonus aethiopoides]
ATTYKCGNTPCSTPLSEIRCSAQQPIMQQSHQSTMSSCFINQHQQTQALFNTNNPYESIPSNKQQIIHSSDDESNSSIISSDEVEFELHDEQIRAMAAILPG